MRRTVLIVPGLCGVPGSESILRWAGPALAELGQRAEVFALEELAPSETPEAAWLGLDPVGVRLRPGPLAVAAFGAEPPERFVHFRVDILSLDGDALQAPRGGVAEADLARVRTLARRLETSRLRWVDGEGMDNALVWEQGSIEMETAPPELAATRGLHQALPVGDGEPLLRRFIDDSVNLLRDEEFNLRRIEEGLDPLNVLWPWGQGFREPVPNLWLERGERLHVESGSLRLEGLARLTKCTHGARSAFGRGTNVRLPQLADIAGKHSPLVIVLDSFLSMRRAEKWEEMEWLLARMDEELLAPMLVRLRAGDTRIALLAPGDHARGLALIAESGPPVEGTWPFDERLLEERKAPTRHAWQLVAQSLQSNR